MLKPFEITNILHQNQESGYSVNLSGDTPKAGYMVGGYVPSLVLEEDSYAPYMTTDRWLTRYQGVLEETGLYAGIWTDSETGKVYVDLSRNVDDLYTALAIATAHGELAIWDVENGREIRTDVTAAELTALAAA